MKKCPACKKRKLQRLIGAGAAILFKGSGFYQTDYRSESYKSAAKADAPQPATDKASTDGKAASADTKPTAGAPAASAGKSTQKTTKS